MPDGIRHHSLWITLNQQITVSLFVWIFAISLETTVRYFAAVVSGRAAAACNLIFPIKCLSPKCVIFNWIRVYPNYCCVRSLSISSISRCLLILFKCFLAVSSPFTQQLSSLTAKLLIGFVQSCWSHKTSYETHWACTKLELTHHASDDGCIATYTHTRVDHP